MESANLTQDDYKALEATRLRLMQVSSAIGTLKASVLSSNPLPNLESLQNHADILQGKIQSVLEGMSSTLVADSFSRITVHPSTNFPGRTQQPILLQLLRKKPEPDVELAMDEGRKIFAEWSQSSDSSDAHIDAGKGGGMGVGELEAVWESARKFCQTRLTEYVEDEGNDMFTEEERVRGVENVRTGLKRSLLDDEDEDEDEDEEEDSDDVMEIDRPPPPPAPGIATQEVEGAALENVMRFAARGEIVAR